jgi:heavy metal translocating P-type ATPase
MTRAKKSLTALADRIPNTVMLWKDGHIADSKHIDQVTIGEEIAVRKGEVVPLDGTLLSGAALLDESSLTGEPYLNEKVKNDTIRSGTINSGDLIVIKVTKTEKESGYRKIIDMVKQAQSEKSPFIRLADKYSTLFTLVTFVICAVTYSFTRDFGRVLAVLVIATPCPLILATPIALMGGMNTAAKRRIILKRLLSIEVLSRVSAMVFDKTGTLTLGKPSLTNILIQDTAYTQNEVLSIAVAIERNSLHPLAKAVIEAGKKKQAITRFAQNIKEVIGSGIYGEIDGKNYALSKMENHHGMAMQLKEDGKPIAVLEFEDEIKGHSQKILRNLKQSAVELYIFTGDKQKAAEDIVKKLGESVIVKAELSPEDKKNGIAELKKQQKTVGMIGDGINDAPALALADVGMVFSNEEHTAASEAADIVFLGGDLESVTEVLTIGKRTIKIAMQSIVFGIGLSIFGMIFASFGHIPPVAGAFLQEFIDIIVILNALRASR